MHFNIATVLIIATFVSSVYLLLNKSDRLFPMLATIASGIQMLLALGVLSLSVAKFRIDVILPAILVIAGVACWMKESSKWTTTASTIVSLVGAMQLLMALRVLG